jgi:hypothetical protein
VCLLTKKMTRKKGVGGRELSGLTLVGGQGERKVDDVSQWRFREFSDGTGREATTAQQSNLSCNVECDSTESSDGSISSCNDTLSNTDDDDYYYYSSCKEDVPNVCFSGNRIVDFPS